MMVEFQLRPFAEWSKDETEIGHLMLYIFDQNATAFEHIHEYCFDANLDIDETDDVAWFFTLADSLRSRVHEENWCNHTMIINLCGCWMRQEGIIEPYKYSEASSLVEDLLATEWKTNSQYTSQINCHHNENKDKCRVKHP